MENNVKVELIMLSIWSAIVFQSGVLPTSYLTNVKEENIQVYVAEQSTQDLFLWGEGLSENKAIFLKRTTEMEQVTEQISQNYENFIEVQKQISEEKEDVVSVKLEVVKTESDEVETQEEKIAKLRKLIEQKQAEQKAERQIQKAQREAERLAKEEAERLAKEEAERLAKEEAERLAKEEAERLAKEEAERLAKEEAERLAKEEAERLAKEEAERLAKEEAERLAKEEAERLAKEEAEARKLNTDPNTLTFLVNKEYGLPENYVPKLVEPKVKHCQPVGSHKRYMRAEAAEALEDMFAAAKEAGYELWVKTAYRSYKNQYDTYTWVLKYCGVQEAVYYHAVPGKSEHQTGLAVDIVCEASNYENDLSFEKTKEYTWLKENCYKYGFILRYMDGMEHITGYNYEPWHYRYVGVELATYLTEHKMTLEEYYNALPTTDLFQVPEEYQYLIQENTESKSVN